MDISLTLSYYNILYVSQPVAVVSSFTYYSATSNSLPPTKAPLYPTACASSICYHMRYYKEGPCYIFIHLCQYFRRVRSQPETHLDMRCAHELQETPSIGSQNSCADRHQHQWTHKLSAPSLLHFKSLTFQSIKLKYLREGLHKVIREERSG